MAENALNDCYIGGCRCQPAPEHCPIFLTAFPRKKKGILIRIRDRIETLLIGAAITFAEYRQAKLELEKMHVAALGGKE
jgi:hypothetical protein